MATARILAIASATFAASKGLDTWIERIDPSGSWS